MSRADRRRAEHHNRKQARLDRPKGARSRFLDDLRKALSLVEINLVSSGGTTSAGVAMSDQTPWVFTVHAGGRFLTVECSRGSLADVASGVTRAVREALATDSTPLISE